MRFVIKYLIFQYYELDINALGFRIEEEAESSKNKGKIQNTFVGESITTVFHNTLVNSRKLRKWR